jgi:2'-5' RNA ligase
MGEWFTDFDDAWRSFLTRDEPLESFFEQFPEDEFEIEGWLIVPSRETKRAVAELQRRLDDVDGLEPVPAHFLHVWLRGEHGPDLGQLRALAPFELDYARVNCFHTAVVVEAHSSALEQVDAPAHYLPHLTIAVVRDVPDPEAVRRAVVPLRDTAVGTDLVDELVSIRAPGSQTTVLQPWTVVERLALRR